MTDINAKPGRSAVRASSSQVAVLGVGRIGLPVCANLVRAGHEVRAHDTRPERRAAVEQHGATWTGVAAEAVKDADVVITVLPGSPELHALMLGSGGADDAGLLARLTSTQTWIDLTSAAPDLGAELAAAAAARSVAYLDAPLGGGMPAAHDATLTLYVGGPAAVLDQQRGLLESIAAPDRIHRMGPSGAGYLSKLLVNLVWFGQAVAVGEALLLATEGGIALDQMHRVLAMSPASSEFITQYLPALYDGDYLRTFGLGRCVEELDSVLRFAAETVVPTPLASRVAELYRSALERFGAVDGELLGIAHLEDLAGRRLRIGH
ncbi:MAG: hypothetical protein QOF92_1774 [Pseudonocardiales bacterium]|jgi:3-hydroxyisobutyrate dehydrogenase|nr:hypothetical protein [Pseudonocardiales bacterium]